MEQEREGERECEGRRYVIDTFTKACREKDRHGTERERERVGKNTDIKERRFERTDVRRERKSGR